MKNEEKIFMIFLLAVMLLMIFFSFQFSSGSKMLPLLSGLFAALITGFLVIMSFSSAVASWYQQVETRSVISQRMLNTDEKKRELSVVAWFTGCVAVIYLFGFMISIPLFLFLFLKIWARESWLFAVVLAVAVLAIVYFTFVYILRIPLHEGILLT